MNIKSSQLETETGHLATLLNINTTALATHGQLLENGNWEYSKHADSILSKHKPKKNCPAALF